MAKLLHLIIILITISSCAGDEGGSSDTGYNGPAFVQHFRNGQYPDSSYDGCQDTYMRSDSITATYGTSSTIIVMASSSSICRILIRFNILGELPADITIRKAFITLYSSASISGTNDPEPYSVDIEAWVYLTPSSYGTPSWDDYTWNENPSLVSSATFDTNFNNYHAIEIPGDTIKQWMKNYQLNWGLIIKVADESITEGLQVSSSDNTNINQRPMLSVFYTY